MRRGMAVATLLGAAAIFGAPLSAHADQITFGPSAQAIQLTGNGLGLVNITIPAGGLTGPAFFASAINVGGTFSLSVSTPTTFTVGPVDGFGMFPVVGTATSTFEFKGGSDDLVGTATFTTVTDHSHTPRFNGTLSNFTTLTGDAAFLAAFAGGAANFDFNLANVATFMTDLAFTRNSESSLLSSGEVVGTVPIPGALPLFAGGLAGLWALVRKRKREVTPSLPQIA